MPLPQQPYLYDVITHTCVQRPSYSAMQYKSYYNVWYYIGHYITLQYNTLNVSTKHQTAFMCAF